ncbi:MAG: Crp/Fnr family transcriptional regulator [Calditrichia bacterium]|nr:Crp/Fnr family transcriptional regulator [Calditrichota bacterium]MCB0267928.1 Crp/Fnr family transcriptional regulator [Calditrichota bacterium]MCB0285839.1 Crp/Fnr family transcriptional regulator [Calditrichota bacterium]MCB9070448.1 Crp/Fnr family transcriptional regulator [Calditrichia bacterium]
MRQRTVIPSCKDCNAQTCSIFNVLSCDEQDKISDNKGGNFYKRGQHIFFEGTRPSGVFCIHKGKVKIYKIDHTGNEQIVRLAKDGDILGYRSVVSNELYASFAAALEDSLICFIPRSVFLELLTSNGQLSMQMMIRLSKELKSAERRLAEMAQKPVRERLAEALLVLQDVFGVENDGETLDVRLKREDFAHLVGTTTETAIRFLSEFKHEGLIEVNGRSIKILQNRKLTQVANIYE